MKIIEWRNLAEHGFPTLAMYEASNTGLIRNIKTGYIFSARLNDSGYVHHYLTESTGRHHDYLCHRIIARVFLGEPTKERYEVNHKDLDKTNNDVSNLEYVSRLENVRHYWQHRADNNKELINSNESAKG